MIIRKDVFSMVLITFWCVTMGQDRGAIISRDDHHGDVIIRPSYDQVHGNSDALHYNLDHHQYDQDPNNYHYNLDNIIRYEPDLPATNPGSTHHQDHVISTRVDEYGRAITPPPTAPAVAVARPVQEDQQRPGRSPGVVVSDRVAPQQEPTQYDDEPFLHHALDTHDHQSSTAEALDHDAGEMTVKASGDDLTIHVGKNKVKTETVATITATITATDEHEDSYINVHRDAHQAAAGHDHDHMEGSGKHLDGNMAEGLDQVGGNQVVGPSGSTPAPDLSFLQDVEVLKVLFPWIDKHGEGQEGGRVDGGGHGGGGASPLDQVMI
uniref:Uncharacterized protein n=1 Tax=Spongospora subterranea TaxID=70186 RepID=A0A0H5RE08_9EUKA|eukprot:CRZ12253.1 hypothetical protein [Spongospora subterranea]